MRVKERLRSSTCMCVCVHACARAHGCPLLLASACIYEAVRSVPSTWLYRSSREREYQNKGVEKSEGDGERKDEEQEYVKESRKRRDGRGKAVDVA